MTLKFKIIIRAIDEEIDFKDEYTADYNITAFRERSEDFLNEMDEHKTSMEKTHRKSLVKAKKHLKIVYH